MAGDGDDNVRTSETIGEFGDCTSGSVALDLNASHNEVANRIGHDLTGIVDACAMGSTAVFGEQAEDAFGELGL